MNALAVTICTLAFAVGGCHGSSEASIKQQRRVFINDRALMDEQLQQLEQNYRTPIRDGSYWYDRKTGAWGFPGGPTSGFVHPDLDIGGALRADASHGDTGVFINGRELHRIDVQGLRRLGPVLQGRWWMDAAGNFGAEHGPWLGNIWLAARSIGALDGAHGGSAWVAYGKYGSGAIGSDASGNMFANFGDLSWPP